jgi:hypothetical protein
MAKHFMIDLETMAVSPRAVILTVGAVTFDPLSDEIFEEMYFRVDIDDQDKLGREIDPNTLDWWAKQDPAIMEEAFSPDDRVPFAESIERIRKLSWGCKNHWSHGAVFDLIIVEDACRQLNLPLPWNFWQCRDTRTLFDLADPDMPQAEKHNALADAKRQAIGVQNVMRKLGRGS